MLIRTDPFRERDRLTQQLFGTDGSVGTAARPTMMPMDAWRDAGGVHVELDLPGLSPDAIDLDIERNVVTVRAERKPTDRQTGPDVEQLAAERPLVCSLANSSSARTSTRADLRTLRGGRPEAKHPDRGREQISQDRRHRQRP